MKGIFAKIIADIPKDELLFDDLSFSISQQIHARMEKKGLSQKKIAAILGCSEAAVSKNLSGNANLTLKTIAKLLTALSAEMKTEIIDAGSEGFWFMASKGSDWRSEDDHYNASECIDVSSIAA